MAGERTVPGMGLTAFWDLGDDTWKPGMDTNLVTLSVLAGGWVASREVAAPGAPVQGDIVIANSDWGATVTDKSIQAYDNAAWVEITPYEGLLMYDRATDELLRYDGAAWAVFSSGGGGGGGAATSSVPIPFQGFYATKAGGSTQAIANNVFTTVIFDNEVFDTPNGYDPVTGIFTVPAELDGKYMAFTASILNNSFSIENVTLLIYKNGGAFVRDNRDSTDSYAIASPVVQVTAGDQFLVTVYTSTATLAADTRCHFSGFVVNPDIDMPQAVNTYVVAGEGTYLTSALSGTISTSAFAMKGNIWTNGLEDIVLKQATFNIDNDTEGATYVAQVGILDALDVVTEVLHTSDPWSTALLGNVTFDLGNVSIPASARFAVVLVRTDGTGASVTQCTFPATTPSPIEQDSITHVSAVRLGDNDMGIGDDLTYASGSNVGCQLDFLTVDSAQAALDGLFDSVVKSGKFASISPTVNQVLTASTLTALTMGQADADVGGWWNAANPTVLTVPAGVSHIDVTAGFQVDVSAGSIDIEAFIQKNGTSIAYQRSSVSAWGGMTLSKGVIPVSEGDQIRVTVWATAGVTLRSSRVFLSAQAVRDSVVYTPPIRILTRDASFDVTEAMLDGRTYVEVDSATPVVVTVPANLKGAGPLVVEGVGAGTVTFAGAVGVTINSFDSLLALAGQHAVATLKPKGGDVFSLFGNLA